MESSGLKQRARHETILPFTRYLAGPADYTTMVFTERRGIPPGPSDRVPGDVPQPDVDPRAHHRASWTTRRWM